MSNTDDQAWNARHVPNCEYLLDRLPLPAPTTSRNLLPRFATTALSRLYSPGASGSSNSRSPSLALSRSSPHPARARTSTRTSPLNLSASSSRKHVMQSAMAQSSGSSRVQKKRRTQYGCVPEGWGTSDEEDEVDQLVSDNDNELPPPSQESVGGSSSQQIGSQSTSASRSFMAVPTNNGVLPQVTSSTSVSSPSLAKILNPVNIEQISCSSVSSSPSNPNVPAKSSSQSRASNPKLEPEAEKKPEPKHEPLSAYTCPICFFPPTNATLTPCGHICCGSCLFTAVKTTMQRGMATGEGNIARCPVCRAEITKWDGKGGGVIGLKARAVFSL